MILRGKGASLHPMINELKPLRRRRAATEAYFFILCPDIEGPDKAECFGASTWASRGWCCLERQIRRLESGLAGGKCLEGKESLS